MSIPDVTQEVQREHIAMLRTELETAHRTVLALSLELANLRADHYSTAGRLVDAAQRIAALVAEVDRLDALWRHSGPQP